MECLNDEEYKTVQQETVFRIVDEWLDRLVLNRINIKDASPKELCHDLVLHLINRGFYLK